MDPVNPGSFGDPALSGGYGHVTPDAPDPGQGDDTEPGRVTDRGPAEADRGVLTLVGYRVEATDGAVGTVDDATEEAGAQWFVVDTGPWIFGRKVLLPAGTVRRVDHLERVIHVDRTRELIRNSPGYDPGSFGAPEYRRQVGAYYADTGPSAG